VHRLRPGDRRGCRAGLSRSQDPKEIVRVGYDAIAERYSEWAGSIESPAFGRVCALSEGLPKGSAVLELGCGRGIPYTRELARRHEVTGVDISAKQIELARRDVPEATFIQADASELELANESFDAAVALFMFGHVPRADQPALVGRVFDWLRPGGIFLATFGGGDAHEVIEEDWLGAPTFFASLGVDEYRRLLPKVGFDVLEAEVVPQLEHGREARFLWAVARKRL
jgi:SAM-dependent methyltransferase